jgi:uncharacterized repeat protein (TIGR01451 family)
MKVLPLIAAYALTAVGCFWSLTGPAQASSTALVFSKTADNLTPNVGDLFDYTITITDNGLTLTNTSVTDPLPSGIMFEKFLSTPTGTSASVDATGTIITWTIGDLAPVTTDALELQVMAVVTGLWTNTATLNAVGAGGGPDLQVASATVDVTPLPAALPLFATGIGALGLLGWRRKRKVKAVA